MFQGNWTCSTCGGAITQLPFEPRSNAGLTCRDCYFNKKNGNATTAPAEPTEVLGNSDHDDRDVPPFDPESFVASEPTPVDPMMAAAPIASGERQMFEGDWSCSLCGNAITKLPFTPRSTENLKCIDCFKKG